MLAARRLYPGAVVGAVRLAEPQRARVLPAARRRARPGRGRRGSSSDAIRRLIVVETVHASRLGELEPVALDPSVEKVVFDHHAGDPPEWAAPEHVVISEDGALTTTLVGILAEREIAVDAARGDRLRARHPRGHRLADVPERDAARRRGARVVPAPRREPGAARPVPAHAARRRRARRCSRRSWTALEPHDVGRRRGARRGRRLAALRRRDLEPRAQGRRPDRLQGARAPRRDGRARVLRGAQPDRRARRGRRSRQLLGGGGHRAGGVGDLRAGRSTTLARALERGSASAARRPLRRASVMSTPGAHGPLRTRRSPRALVACQRYGAERDPGRGGRPPRRRRSRARTSTGRRRTASRTRR